MLVRDNDWHGNPSGACWFHDKNYVNTARQKYIIFIFNVFSDLYRVYIWYRIRMKSIALFNVSFLLLTRTNIFAEACKKRSSYEDDINGLSQDCSKLIPNAILH